MYLFEPEAGSNYSLEEHHLALISQKLGRIPKEIYIKGEYSTEFIDFVRFLRHILKKNVL